MPRPRWSITLLTVAALITLVAAVVYWEPGRLLEHVRTAPALERLALVLLLFVLVPPLFERLMLPGALGLILGGVAIGPFALGVIDPESDAIELFSSLGRVFLMFFAGLEVDLRVFQQRRDRSLTFGAFTFTFPLLAGVLVGRSFDFGWTASFLIGSLMASHTLLGYPILSRMGLAKTEVVAVTLGATIFTDIASLLVLAVCIGIHTGGFSVLGLATQLGGLAVFTVLVLVGIPYVGVRFIRRFRGDEMAVFMFTLLALLVASVGAHVIHLEDIVGAFLTGLAVNRVVGRTAGAEKLRFLGEALFIPAFFLAIGLRLDLPVFGQTVLTSFGFVAAIVAALVISKFMGAGVTGLVYRYGRDDTMTMWSLSLPQVAATLAAAVAAYSAVDALGERLITESVLNAVIVLMVVTSVLGPVLTDHFGKRLAAREENREAS
jgi:Kef-type K+ transport system membrane component KefB